MICELSEARYKRLFEAAQDGILILDADSGQITDVNPFLVDLIGFSKEELLNKKLWDIGFIKDNEKSRDLFSKVQEKGYVRYEDLPLETKDGRSIDVEFVSNIYSVDGKNVIQCNVRDITDRRLAKINQKLEIDVLNILNHPYSFTDTIRNILRLIMEKTGIEAAGLRLRQGDDFPYYHTSGFPGDFVQTERFLCDRDESGQIISGERGNPILECMCGNVICGRTDDKFPFFTAGGSFWTNSTTDLLASTTEEERQSATRNRCNREGYESVALIPLRASGEAIGLLQLNDRRCNQFTPEIIAFFEDLGNSIGIALSRKQAEEALKASEEKFRGLFNSMGEAVQFCELVFDEGGRPVDNIILDVNPAYEKHSGLTRDLVIGRRIKEMLPVVEQIWLDRYGEVVRTGKQQSFKEYNASLNMWFEVDASPASGNRFYAVFSDITERKKTEEALQKGEEKYRTLFNSAADAIVIHDLEGHFLEVNDETVKQLGYSRDELLRLTPEDIDSPESARQVKSRIQEILDKGFKIFESVHATKDGRLLPAEVHAHLINYAGKKSILAIWRDISERKQAVKEIESLARFPEENPNPVLRIAADGTIIYANRSGALLLESWDCQVGQKLPEDYKNIALATLGSGNRNEVEIGSAGKIFSLVFTSIPESDYINVYGREVTKHRQAEEELRASERRYRQIVDTANEGIMSVDKDFIITFVNTKMANMLGYEPDKMISFPVHHFMYEEDVQDHEKRKVVRMQGVSEQYERRFRRKDGKVIWALISASPLKDSQDRFSGSFAMLTDISDRKEIEIAIEDSERRLKDIISFLPDATFVLDKDGKVTAWNRAMEEMTGVRENDMIGQGDHACTVPFYGERRMHLLDLLDKDDREIASKYQYVQRKGDTLYAETFTPALNGGKGAYVWATVGPIFDFHGNRAGAIESIRDITDRKQAEEELKRVQSSMKIAMDLVKLVRWEYDVETDMFAFDDQFYALYGTTAEREGGPLMSSQDYARKFIPPEEASVVAEETSKALATTDPNFTSQVEHRIIRADGTEGFIAVRFGIIKDGKGRTIRTFGANQDITERKRAEYALRESEQRQADLIDFLPDATFAVDREGKVIAWNRAIEEMTGIPKEEMVGKSGYAYAVPFFGEARPILIDLVIREMKEIDQKYSFFRRKGDQLIAEAFAPMLNQGKGAYLWGIAGPIYGSNGSIMGAIQSIRDITERKQAEFASKRSLARQEQLNQLQQILLSSGKLELKLKKITDSVVDIFGADFCRIWITSPGDLCEVGCIHATVTEGPNVCRYRDRCLRLIASSGRYTHTDGEAHKRVPFGYYKVGRIASGEDHRFLTNDVQNDPIIHNHEWAKEIGLVSFAGYQLRPSDGDILGVLALFSRQIITTDEDAQLESLSNTVTRVIQADRAGEELLRSRDELELRVKERTTDLSRKNAEMERFIYTVSHDLRTPLSSMSGFLGFLKQDAEKGDMKRVNEDLRIVSDAVTKMDKLLLDTLELSRIGRIVNPPENVPFGEIVTEALAQSSAKLSSKNIKVTVGEDLPIVQVDRMRLAEVLVNLVENSLKYMGDQRHPEIEIGKRLDGENTIFFVRDNGIGIDPAQHDKVFELFYKVNQKSEGSGAGLAIAKKIIEVHGGRIWIESELGKGCTVFFTLEPVKPG